MWSLTEATASTRTPRERLPRRSIFTRPSSSTSYMSHWVMATPLAARSRDRRLVRGMGETTTPPQCTERWRGKPSIQRAMSSRSCQGRSLSGALRDSGREARASAKCSKEVWGMARAMTPISSSGTPMALPTSRNPERAEKVLWVAIMQTLPSP